MFKQNITYEKIKKLAFKKEERPEVQLLLRPLSSRLTWLLINLRPQITPSQISAFGFLIALLGIYLLMLPNEFAPLLGGITLFIWGIFDCVDGEIARVTNRGSLSGAYLDNIIDNSVAPLVFIALSIHVYKTTQDINVIYLGILSSISLLLIRLSVGIRAENLIKANITQRDIGTNPKGELERVKKESKQWYRKVGFFFLMVRDILGRTHVYYFLIIIASVLDILISPMHISSYQFTFLCAIITLYTIMVPITVVFFVGFYIQLKEFEVKFGLRNNE